MQATGVTPAVEIAGLSFDYGERRALNEVSFAIARGEIFGLLGPNGGGKTTLFKLLSTLVPMQQGDVRILGFDLRSDTIALRRRHGRGLPASERRRQADGRREPRPSRTPLRN